MAGALTSRPPARRTLRAVDALWRFLRRPSLAVGLALLLLGMLLLAQLIPQIPGQAAEDPASAIRWLNAERGAWGAWSGFVRTMGLYNISGSPLFFALLALLALVCGVQLAAQIGVMQLPRRLNQAYHAPAGVSPLPLEAMESVNQLRMALEAPPATAIVALHEEIVARFGPSPMPEPLPGADGGPGDEVRILAVSGMRRLWLRPLLPAGALLALAVLWFGAVFGWNVRPPTLAPGDTFVSQPHSVAITYTVSAPGSGILDLTVGDQGAALAEGETRTRIGGATVRAAPGAPALLLRAEEPVLALPGETEMRRSVGLVFPQVGSEQIVLLPKSGAGVRVVRLQGDSSDFSRFLVEAYARDGVQPMTRVEAAGDIPLTLALGDNDLPLQLAPLRGIDVEVRRAPGQWLLWPALALMLAGAVGLSARPRFVLAQLLPWPVGRSVLTLQCSDEAIIKAVSAAPE